MRKQLKAEILALDTKLVLQRYQIADNAQRRIDRLRRIPPLWLVGGGFGSGFLVGRLQKSSSGSLWQLYLTGMRAWGIANMILPPAPLDYGRSL
ncbi:MAG: hypothetical protein WC997_05545 [Porticoccaceae bacterium]